MLIFIARIVHYVSNFSSKENITTENVRLKASLRLADLRGLVPVDVPSPGSLTEGGNPASRALVLLGRPP